MIYTESHLKKKTTFVLFLKKDNFYKFVWFRLVVSKCLRVGFPGSFSFIFILYRYNILCFLYFCPEIYFRELRNNSSPVIIKYESD